MNEPSSKPLSNRKAVYGSIAILWFCVALCLYLYAADIILEDVQAWAMILGTTQGKEDGGVTYLVFTCLACSVLGLVFAVTGLVRAERPRWPAIVGLFLGMLPLALFLLNGD